jgi:hypothetical protein
LNPIRAPVAAAAICVSSIALAARQIGMQIDAETWEEVRLAYADASRPLAEIAARFGLTPMRIGARAKREGWPARNAKTASVKRNKKAPVKRNKTTRSGAAATQGSGALPTRGAQASLIGRLYRAISLKLEHMEKRMASGEARSAQDEERESRAHIGERGLREIEGRSIDPEVYIAPTPRPRDVTEERIVFDGIPHMEFLDLPLLRGDEPPEAGYVAAFQLPWPGSVALYGSPEDAGYVMRARATAPAVMGVTLDSLPPGPIAVIDRASRLRVEVSGGELASVTRLQLLAGANAAAIRNEAGGWEVIQFETATLVGTGTYELANLLRGQGGTELEMRAALPAGATFVPLGSEIVRVRLAAGEVGLPLHWRYGPANRDIADRTYAAAIHAFAGRGLRPLSPAHVRASRSSGDIALSWKRRTRVGGDGWETAEVPLAEDGEAYEVDVLDGGTVVRTIASAAPACSYSAAEQTADFGSPQSTLSVAVYQMSAAYGRGTPKRATV